MHGHLGAVAGRLIILRLERRLDKGALRRQNHSKPLQHPQRTDKKEPPESGSFLFVPPPEAVGIAFARTLRLNPNLRGETPMKIVLTLKRMRSAIRPDIRESIDGFGTAFAITLFFPSQQAAIRSSTRTAGGIQFTG
jgi:hypothetical protein